MEKNKLQTKRERNSSFELLRILSAFMIVICHFATFGDFPFKLDASNLAVPQFWWYFIEAGGYIGVNCFILISGYFLSASAHSTIRAPHFFKLLGQTLFYSVAIFLVACVLGLQKFKINWLIKACFPISNKIWWYATAYVVLYLLHPYLNRLIHAMNRRTYQNLIAILVLIRSVIPLITRVTFPLDDFLWFATLYLIAGYIRLHGLNPKLTARRCFLLFIVFGLMRYAAAIAMVLISFRIPTTLGRALVMFEPNSVFTLSTSVFLFAAFEKAQIKSSRIINTIASASFGVYLLHIGVQHVYPYWPKIFRSFEYQNTAAIIPYSIFAAGVVFVICVIVDLVRQYVLEKPYMRIVNRYSESWLKPFKAIVRAAQRRIFGASSDSE